VPDVDCDALPAGPFVLTKLEGPIASEDLAFDREGHLIGSNDKTIFKNPYPGKGQPKVFVPTINFRAGMRTLPNGQLIVCDNIAGAIVRIDGDGSQHVVMGGLAYPNGLTVDAQGWVYFSEHDANRVHRLHPFTGESTVLTDKIVNPNGLAFSPDYRTLYIGGFSGKGIIYAMSISSDGVPGKLVEWAKGVGSGWLDGIGVDVCGNVYVADFGQTVIFRIRPDGQDIKKIIDSTGQTGAYLPNLQWGTGIGGWKQDRLYLPDGWKKGVFEVDIGVPGAPVPF
jgi:gluconolactonase